MTTTRQRPQAGCEEPDAFVWRGRLYVVGRVVGRWRRRVPWWREALGGPAGAAPSLSELRLEEDVWRVEARPGRSGRAGVYDLVHGERWRLVGVAD